MKRLYLNLPFFALAAFVAASPSTASDQQKQQHLFYETLNAQSLLGSHFGVPGRPAQFDYVIVGGGTAGLAIARRLAHDNANSVAVIEAGGLYEQDNGNLSEIPAQAGNFVGSAPLENNLWIDWGLETEAQPALQGRRVLYSQGKTLGGGSARNLMFYHRGTTGSYKMWADQVNDSSYEFEQFLPYFENAVTFTPPIGDDRPANASPNYDLNVFRPSQGPVQVAYPRWANAISSWYASAVSQLGLSAVSGFTNGLLIGWSYVANTIDPYLQTRSSSETAYLREALRETTSLIVYKETLAKKIVFDGANNATGVQVESAGVNYELSANKEVIISAGVFHSPQLLMVSGVGPAETLTNNNIPVLADLSGVGQNMWDHVFFGPTYESGVLSHTQLADPTFGSAQEEAYIENRTGILTNVGDDFIAFTKHPADSIPPSLRHDLDAAFPPDWPEIELLPFDGYASYLRDLLYDTPPDGKNYVAAFAALVAPFSRGNVTIDSPDTARNPLVSPNWLLDPRDQTQALSAFKLQRTLLTSPAMQPVIIGPEVVPGANVSTDAQILDFIRAQALTVYHAAGTCKMGVRADAEAVVDARARVFGTSGLRVVDASVFPVLPPGHPQATVYALAEKIADDILRGEQGGD